MIEQLWCSLATPFFPVCLEGKLFTMLQFDALLWATRVEFREKSCCDGRWWPSETAFCLAESCRTVKYKQVCYADTKASMWLPISLSGFLIFFPKPMRLTVKLRTLSQFWNSLALMYFITFRDSAGARMLGKYTSRNKKAGGWRRERADTEGNEYKGGGRLVGAGAWGIQRWKVENY